jgi:hypothetical protein
MHDIILALVSFFLVDPFQAEMMEQIGAANVPPEVVQQVTECAGVAAPALAERVMNDPWWGITSVAWVWVGASTADAVLAEAVPACEPALQAVKPYLSDGEA